MPEVVKSEALTGPQTGPAPTDLAIRRLADAQYGVVARSQLLEAGLTAKTVRGRIERGQLLRLHRGVYAVGHRRLRREGYWMAAVLAVGPGAALSHREAAALHAIRPTNRSTIDVTTMRRGAGLKGVDVHGVRSLDPADVTKVEGIPVTTVARTLVDLADVVHLESLAKAMSEAERMQRLDLRAVHAARARTTGRTGPGPQRLSTALQELEAQATTLTRSPLEVSFKTLIDRARLSKPQTNIYVAGHEVDAYWSDQRLVVELDGWRHHNSRRDFERDRARDVELTTMGYRVVRFTHRAVAEQPDETVDTLRRLGVR